MAFNFVLSNVEFLLFIAFLSIFLLIKRKNLNVTGNFPILYMLMYRTKLGLDKMDKWSKKHPRTFLYLAYLSIFIGVVGMILMFGLMFWQLDFIIENQLESGGGLVLPIKTESGTLGGIPVVAPPFFEWLIALFILVIVHEFAHGVIAERFRIKIKSSGFAFLGILAPILPAAFVEPDEKSLAKKERWKQIAVFGAGSTSNFIFGFLFVLILNFAAVPFVSNTMEVEKVTFDTVMNQSDLTKYNVTSGEIIAINNRSVSEYDFVVLNSVYGDVTFLTELTNLSVNESLNLTIRENETVNTYMINTFEREGTGGNGMIGISGFDVELTSKDEFNFLGGFALLFQSIIYWTALLNIGIGMMNLLPLWITDGGQIARSLFEKYFSQKTALSLFNFASFITLILLILSLFPRLLF